ncbi:MAG: hypothetical protein K2O65_07340 [Lachnospiraceae bacterium]|nr:hypothetical protein [Lachnospiraceae bacterium]
MLAFFFQHKNFMIGILALLFASIICQIVMGVIYHRLIWETEHMSTTTNKSLQQLKLKFSGYSKINEKVANVSVFVDKFISHVKIGAIPLSMLKHLSGQLMLLSVLVAGIGACLGIIHNENFFSIVPFYVVSFLGLYCYFAVSSLIDIPGKINILRINLVDYLENHLANRLEQTELDMQMISPRGQDTPDTPQTAAGTEIQNTPAAQSPVPESDRQNKPSDQEAAYASEGTDIPGVSDAELRELEMLLQEIAATFTIS